MAAAIAIKPRNFAVNTPPRLIVTATQNRVKRCEIPNGCNVLGGLEIIGFFEVGVFQEIATHFRHKENNKAKHKQENRNAHQIVHRIKRMKRNAVFGNAIGVFVLS